MSREPDETAANAGTSGGAALSGRGVRALGFLVAGLLAAAPAWGADGGVWTPFGPEGGFVSVRDTSWMVGATKPSRDGGLVGTQHGGATCAMLTWAGAARPGGLPLALDGDGVRLRLALHPTPHGWQLVVESVGVPWRGLGPVPVDCSVDVTFSDAGTPDVVATSAGPIFLDHTTCREQAKPGFERVCVNGVCGDAPGHARLFDLGPCEEKVRQARATLRATDVEPALALATLDRLRQVLRGGGTLYERRAGLTACVRWRVRPTGPLAAKLFSRVVADSVRTDESYDVELHPLQRQAIELSHFEESVALDGGFVSAGGRGSSGGVAVALLLGDRGLFLGRTWYFFDRAACERQSATPGSPSR